MTPEEEFLSNCHILDEKWDDGYVLLADANNYEILQCTPERPNTDGSRNPGAIKTILKGTTEAWIPRSQVAVDKDHNLYVKEWFYDKQYYP